MNGSPTQSSPGVWTARFNRAQNYVIFVFGLLALIWAGYALGFRVNMTPSYPIGLYHFSDLPEEPTTGDLVAFCPDDRPMFALAEERGYIAPGVCPSGLRPLVKRIIAGEGSNIQVAENVLVDGQPIDRSEVRPFDSTGRPLPATQSAVLGEGTYFVMSEFNGNSFDSRYFGPIRKDQLIASVDPVWTASQEPR